jgi:hypothetical protein
VSTTPGSAVAPLRRAWLTDADGVRRRVPPEGLVIGRSAAADLVVSDERSSKRQALVRPTSSGLEVHHLGRNATAVNGTPVPGVARLRSGDRLEVPGGAFLADVEDAPRPRRAEWLVQIGSNLHRVAERLRVGGSPRDDVGLLSVPAQLVVLHATPDGLLLEVGGDGVQLDGEPVDPESLPALTAGSELRLGKHVLTVRLEGELHGHTTQLGDAPTLREVRLEFLPTGADLALQVGRERLECRLSELRARLTSVLLQPPSPLTAGDFVPDEIVFPAVWPRQPDRSHYDVNTLVHRLRKDLLRAGASPTRFLERARGGGGTRFCVDRTTAVRVD